MADKNGYTTIRIKEDSRQKLEALRKGTDLTFSDIIENLLKTAGGTEVGDVDEIKRPAIAMDVRFIDLANDRGKTYDISFNELSKSKLGDVFSAIPSSELPADNYIYEEAEVCFIDCRSVFLRVTERFCEAGKESSVISMHHIDLF